MYAIWYVAATNSRLAGDYLLSAHVLVSAV